MEIVWHFKLDNLNFYAEIYWSDHTLCFQTLKTNAPDDEVK